MFLGGLITCFLVSFILLFFSYLIWRKREFSLISGYNEQTFKGDTSKLAKAVGSFLSDKPWNIKFLFFYCFGIQLIGGIIFTTIIITGIIGLVIYINSINKV